MVYSSGDLPGLEGVDTNFAPLILEDGSLLGLWRSWEATGSRVFLATAPDWRNVSSYVQHHDEVISVDLGTAGTEDPFLYRDDAGHFMLCSTICLEKGLARSGGSIRAVVTRFRATGSRGNTPEWLGETPSTRMATLGTLLMGASLALHDANGLT